MKTKHAILLIAIGFCLDFLGAMWKVMHAPGGNNMLWAATVCKVAGVVILAYKIVTYPRIRDFMNW